MTKLQKFSLIILILIPFMTSMRIDLGWISVTPEILKTGFGLTGIMVMLVWWFIDQYELKKIEIVKTSLYVPIIGFIVWSFFTLIWVEDWSLAIMTLSQYVSYMLLFFLLVNIFKKFEAAKILIIGLIVSMTIVSIIGLIQYYYPEVKLIQNIFVQTAGPGSTFANKNMASHFLVMALPLSLTLLLTEKNKIVATLYALSTAISFWFLIYTLARQAYVAIFIELIVLFIFLILDSLKNKNNSFIKNIKFLKYKSILILLIIIFLGFISNFTKNDDNLKINKVQSIVITENNPRLPAWRNTIEIIKDHPISGVGVGQWQASYPAYYDRVMKDIIFNEKARLKRLHNDYLEVLTNVGLIGYLLLIWIVVFLSNSLWRILSNASHSFRGEYLGVTLGLIGFSTIAMFSFPLRVYLPGVVLMIFFSLVVIDRERGCVYFKIKRIWMTLIIIILLLATGFVAINSYKWINAERHYLIAKALEDIGEYSLSAGAGLEALKLNRYSPEYYAITGRGFYNSNKVKDSVIFYKKSIDISPLNTSSLLNLASAYDLLKNKTLERKILNFIVKIDPRNVVASAQLVRILVENDKQYDARIMYENLKNNFEYFKNRPGFGPYHDTVGRVATSLGDYKYAKYVYKDAIDKNLHMINYVKLGTLEYYHLNNKEIGIKLYKKALNLDSNIPNNKKIKALIQEYESITKH